MNTKSAAAADVKEPNIPFHQLIDGIHHSKLLKELTETYQNLVCSSQRFQVDSIIPILHKRSKVIAKDFDQTSPFNKACLKSIKALTKHSKSVHQKVHEIFDKMNSEDQSTKDHELISKLCEDFDAVDFTIQRMQTVFLDETFEEYSTDLSSLIKKYKKLCGMLEEDENTMAWIVKQVKTDQKELKSYSKEIELSPIKKATLSTYQNTLPVISEIFQFQEFISKRKAINPLVANDLIITTTELNSLTHSLIEEFNKWINLIYQYDQQIRVVQEHIKCFNQLVDLMEH